MIKSIQKSFSSRKLSGFKFLLFILLFFLTSHISSLKSQIIDNRLGNAFEDEMFFNQEFLWQNKITSITGTVSIKRTGRPIETRPDITVYRLNDVGLLHQIDKVTSVLHLVDTASILFRRNDLGEVELRSENGTKGYFTTQFNYDKEGHVTRIDFGKSENVSQEKSKLEPGQSIIINSETFAWSDAGDGALRRSNYNNYGLHYSNTTITTNALGYITSEVEELIMSGRTTTHTYTYNERGWIAKIEASDNQNSPLRSKTFFYDDIGNLSKVEYREDDKLLREVEVLYTETMLIEALLDLDFSTNDITITKFTYEFRTPQRYPVMKTKIILLFAVLLCGFSVDSFSQKQKKKPPKQENVRTPETAAHKDAENRARINQEYEDKLEKHRNLQDKPTQKRMKKTYNHAKNYGNQKPLPFYKRWFRKKKF